LAEAATVPSHNPSKQRRLPRRRNSKAGAKAEGKAESKAEGSLAKEGEGGEQTKYVEAKHDLLETDGLKFSAGERGRLLSVKGEWAHVKLDRGEEGYVPCSYFDLDAAPPPNAAKPSPAAAAAGGRGKGGAAVAREKARAAQLRTQNMFLTQQLKELQGRMKAMEEEKREQQEQKRGKARKPAAAAGGGGKGPAARKKKAASTEPPSLGYLRPTKASSQESLVQKR